jgi:hypothetical protein
MQFGEFLARQRWTKVRVALPHDVDHAGPVRVWQRAVAALAATCRYQSCCATSLVSVSQTLDLPNGQPQRFSGLALRRALLSNQSRDVG